MEAAPGFEPGITVLQKGPGRFAGFLANDLQYHMLPIEVRSLQAVTGP
jgi:hypothetical protein